jgi:hypothetical protein
LHFLEHPIIDNSLLLNKMGCKTPRPGEYWHITWNENFWLEENKSIRRTLYIHIYLYKYINQTYMLNSTKYLLPKKKYHYTSTSVLKSSRHVNFRKQFPPATLHLSSVGNPCCNVKRVGKVCRGLNMECNHLLSITVNNQCKFCIIRNVNIKSYIHYPNSISLRSTEFRLNRVNSMLLAGKVATMPARRS